MDQRVRKAQIFIANHVESHIGTRDISRAAAVSSSRLRVLFKTCIGTTPKRYLISVRMNTAREWLSKENVSVKEVAGSLGFHHTSQFCRLFKRIFGITPSEASRIDSPPKHDIDSDNIDEERQHEDL
jgi:transcriptional regulator GlxA family with amidase domain